MSRSESANRRGICTLTGMAMTFRVFYEAAVDSGQTAGGAWISVLLGMVMAVPAACCLAAVRRSRPGQEAGGALGSLVGSAAVKGIALICCAVMVCDAAASLRIMSSTVKYVAMPESNRVLILLTGAAAASVCAGMGVKAAAGGAVLWRRLAVILLAVMVIAQAREFRGGWLSPVLGPGWGELIKASLPVAGIFSFIVAGWLLMEPEHDRAGYAMLLTLIRSGLMAAGVMLAFGMLVPPMPEEDPMRTFRLGQLLTNGRGGLSLEMPYVTLLYSGFLTMLVFETTAGARLLGLLFPDIQMKWRACLVGGCAFLIAASGGVEQAAVRLFSRWYYPVLTVAAVIPGCAALVGKKKRKQEENVE